MLNWLPACVRNYMYLGLNFSTAEETPAGDVGTNYGYSKKILLTFFETNAAVGFVFWDNLPLNHYLFAAILFFVSCIFPLWLTRRSSSNDRRYFDVSMLPSIAARDSVPVERKSQIANRRR